MLSLLLLRLSKTEISDNIEKLCGMLCRHRYHKFNNFLVCS
jgi:hypothetical protein